MRVYKFCEINYPGKVSRYKVALLSFNVGGGGGGESSRHHRVARCLEILMANTSNLASSAGISKFRRRE